ncbi:MAG: short-chain dehydrogenase [Chlorobi bacterium]|nr:short-chain dehydrogenase [Candidatus Kapabacteria bacterium]MCX7929936.1 short-chain dehydrogenase [Chlorobiota bacterium]MDW8075045.1 short-chain dehydrogenase [Bacteroidota bacterium]
MQLKGSTILVLGGWGLVGSAIIQRLMRHEPARVIVTSLRQQEAEEAVAQLRRQYSLLPAETFVPWWGNIFTRTEWKDLSRDAILQNPEYRRALIEETLGELSEHVLRRQALYDLLMTYQPDAVIDCVNTATAIAYQDIYTAGMRLSRQLATEQPPSAEEVEYLLASLYIPQLVRHVQILYHSLREAKVQVYLKVGTSGTGGMGLNIPFTHSEERPSRLLLSKAAIAGAHSLLLFLMARTPGAPVVKEVKPSAAIGWKRIGYGPIIRRGQIIERCDMPIEHARRCEGELDLSASEGVVHLNIPLESVFIDTGENGVFGRAEFETVTTIGLMEMVTPEEIAHVVVEELRGASTGREIVGALDASVMGPTYRAGALRERALSVLRTLESQYGTSSIGFELLGPPRLTKLLYEAAILRAIAGSIRAVAAAEAIDLARRAEEFIGRSAEFRSTVLSVGLPILLSDGQRYLRGSVVLVPSPHGHDRTINPENIERWCHDGWIDLRPSNWKVWIRRCQALLERCERHLADTSSREEFTAEYWNNFETIDEGKLAAYILYAEEGGGRTKR